MKKKIKEHIGIILALVSAAFCAFNIIFEKIYIKYISSEKILFLMYLGAGIGLFLIHLYTEKSKRIKSTDKITKKDIPSITIIVICELLASFFIIEAVKKINASLVSLLLIFEVIMTSICAYLLFKDPITKNERLAIILVVTGGIILNFQENIFSNVNIYSLLVIGACLCWGIENNFTASISTKQPSLFTSIKCFAVSMLYLLFIILKGDLYLSHFILILFGFFTYGVSILTYALSTKYLGANKATLIFSFSSIFGAILSIIIFKEKVKINFIISTILMIMGILVINKDETRKEQ